jgi:hypothetical protein
MGGAIMVRKFLVRWMVVITAVIVFFAPFALGAQEYGLEHPLLVAQLEPELEEGEPLGGDQAEQEAERKEIIKEGTEQVLIQTGGVLIPKGTFVLEPAFSYTHFDRSNIAISGFTIYQALVVGTIEVAETDRDIFSLQLTGRYGITNRLQVDARVPYLVRRDESIIPASTTGDPSVSDTVYDWGIGDFEAGINYHFFQGKGSAPDLLANLRVKTTTGSDPYEIETKTVEGRQVPTGLPTGSGHWGVAGGLTFSKVSDPIVYYGGMSYFWNIERDVGGDFGTINPGNSVDLFLGMALALNEKSSLTIAFQDIWTQETQQNGDDIVGSSLNSGTVFLGASYRINRRFNFLTSLGFGVTKDAANFQLSFAVPIYF